VLIGTDAGHLLSIILYYVKIIYPNLCGLREILDLKGDIGDISEYRNGNVLLVSLKE
jgi:hypothetical protein